MDVEDVEVAHPVWHARALHVEWMLAAEGGEVALVDTGYPGDRTALVASLERIALHADVVVVGHGPPFQGRSRLPWTWRSAVGTVTHDHVPQHPDWTRPMWVSSICGPTAARRGHGCPSRRIRMFDMFDDLLDELDPDRRAAVSNVMAQVQAIIPDAQPGRSYGVPALRWRGRPLLGVSVAKTHLSLLPFSSAVVAAVADRLDGFRVTKGAIGFTADHPVPEDVIADMVRLRVAEIDG